MKPISPNTTVSELMNVLQNKIKRQDYKDSVHKITLMTALEVIERLTEKQ
jgi:hypothetical protein